MMTQNREETELVKIRKQRLTRTEGGVGERLCRWRRIEALASGPQVM